MAPLPYNQEYNTSVSGGTEAASFTKETDGSLSLTRSSGMCFSLIPATQMLIEPGYRAKWNA